MKYLFILLVGFSLFVWKTYKNMPIHQEIKLNEQLKEIKETINAPQPSTYYLINTVFVPQAPEGNWDQPWQDACEEAALLTGYYYLNSLSPSLSDIKSDLEDMLLYEKTQSLAKDINIKSIAHIAEQYLKLDTIVLENPSLDEIKDQIRQNHPIVVPASGKILFSENNNFRNGGPDYHNLTILGFDDKSHQFIVHDVGTRKGAYFRYSYDVLLNSIHDLPPSGDKHQTSQGVSRVLVLLK